MNRHMFISTHNYWFSRLALLSSLILLSYILLETYTQLLGTDNSTQTWAASFKPYIIHGMTFIALFLALAALYLHRAFGYKPFMICVGLFLFAISQYFIDSWSLAFHMTPAFEQTLLNLCILNFLWWLASVTGPRDYVHVSERDKKYKPWAWLGLLLLFSQMLLNAWLTSGHTDFICANFLYCDGKFPEFNFQALTTLPLSLQGLITLYSMCVIATTIYLTIFSISFIFNRALGEIGILIVLFMLTQIILGIIAWVLQPSLWITFGHSIVSIFLLLTIISLLITLHRNFVTSYH